MAVGDRVFLGSPGNDLTVEVEVDTAPLPEPTDLDVGVRNEGTINAAGGEIVLAAAGDIYSQAISNVGTLSASVRAGEAGKVKLVAEEGKVVNSGSITATSDSAAIFFLSIPPSEDSIFCVFVCRFFNNIDKTL